MSKKLLEENTIRKFMKLANLGGLSQGFLKEEKLEEEGDYGNHTPQIEEDLDEEHKPYSEADEVPGDEDMDTEEEPEAEVDMDLDLEEPPEDQHSDARIRRARGTGRTRGLGRTRGPGRAREPGRAC